MEPAAAPAAEKPKRVLSEEQKAKMAAGRAAAKARRDAEKANAVPAAEAAPAAEKPKRVLSEEQKAKMAAGRAAARERKAAEKAAAAPDTEDTPAAKPAKPKRVLTDEQKAKMAAGRAAARERKAANAVPAAAPAVEKPAAAAAPAEPETELVEVRLVDWEHDFGTGSRTYKRLDDDGMTYIYDYETRKYLGAYVEKTNKLKPSVPDPLAADD